MYKSALQRQWKIKSVGNSKGSQQTLIEEQATSSSKYKSFWPAESKDIIQDNQCHYKVKRNLGKQRAQKTQILCTMKDLLYLFERG